MSTASIISNRALTPTSRLVFLALHNLADDTGRIEMRVPDLANCAGTDGSSVKRAMAALKRAGVLCVDRAGVRGTPQVLRLLDAPQGA